jgi:hypothetical protein
VVEVAPLSKTRYKWWGYIKAVIRAYPSLKKEYEELHEQSITAKLSSLPGGGEVTRGTEDIAIRELPHTKQREYEAVRRAIDATKRIEGGDRRVMIIDLVYWKNSHTLAGAAMKAGYSYDRAKQMHREFIVTVAKYYGLMDS